MLKILQLSDLHIQSIQSDTLLGINTEYYFHKVLEQAFQRHPNIDLILITGDLAQDPCPAAYQRIQAHLVSYQTPTLCLPGNHDDYGLMQSILNTALISCEKQKILSHWQVVCLNSQKTGSAKGYLSDSELDFLRRSLQLNLPTLIALHHHPVATGSEWMDSMQVENSKAFWQLLTEFPQVKLVIHGHVHQLLANVVNSVAVYSSPATCLQFAPLASEFKVTSEAPGYRIYQLYPDGQFDSTSERISENLVGLDIAAHCYE